MVRQKTQKVFDQSICRTKEQKTKLQYLASAMPKSVMPSAAKNGKVFKEKKRKNLAVLTKTPRLKRFFSVKLLSSNFKTVGLTIVRENVGETQVSKHLSHSDWLAILTCYSSGVYVCNLWFLLIVRLNVVSCRVTL